MRVVEKSAGKVAFNADVPGFCPAAGKGDHKTASETNGPTTLVHTVSPYRVFGLR